MAGKKANNKTIKVLRQHSNPLFPFRRSLENASKKNLDLKQSTMVL